MAASVYPWRFFRAGGFDQVRIETGADIEALPGLDQKLWVALSCPTRGIEFDTKTLDLIDSDHDGRIRAPEILAAVAWTTGLLKDLDVLVADGDALPLAAIDDSRPDGARLRASAKRILHNLGKGEAETISIEDTADTVRIFAQTKFNGDGVVAAGAASDAATAAVIAEIIATLGGVPDRSGEIGIDRAKLDVFFAEAAAFAAWWDGADAKALALGEATADAHAAFAAVRAKIDDYVTRARLAAYDSRAAATMNRSEAEFAALAARDLSVEEAEVAAFPLARVEAGRSLPLGEGVNPAWSARVAVFRDRVVRPMLGPNDSLGAEQWNRIKDGFAAFETWQAAKAGRSVEGLGIERVRRILSGDARARIDGLIAQDEALTSEAESIAEVDRLVRFRRDLYPLLNNFVSFRDFYTRRGKALFQVGRLFIDGRSCDLCVKVDDPAKHATLAGLSRIYLAYCECTRLDGAKMTIAAALTGGDADQIMVGRNGVFYDRHDRDWDATVVKIVEHPISIRQAFWAPYKQLGKMVGGQIEKVAAARAQMVQIDMAKTTAQAAMGTSPAVPAKPVAASAPAAPAAPAQPFDAGRFAGIFAAIGLAIGAIGTAIASVVTGFLNLSWWQMPLALAGLLLVVSGPSIIIAYMKLRQRNLGPILDANGWAVNARAKINIPFGASLTQLAKLPEGAERALTDPYAEKSPPWKTYAALAAIAALVVAVGFSGPGKQMIKRVFSAPPTASAPK